MTRVENQEPRPASTVSEDGTRIGYVSLGAGPGLIIVGGGLSAGADYLALARILGDEFEVHLMDRRGRPGSEAQRPGHSIDDECADLRAVAVATGATAVFGHSFGGLVALETARRDAIFDQLFVYEPGVPLRGEFDLGWLEGYQRLMEQGDRRGAFAWMVKHAGFAPRPTRMMPLMVLRGVLRLALRGEEWASMSALMEENLVEHRILADVDSPSAERFATIAARTVLLGGSRSPETISRGLLRELAGVIPNAEVAVLPGLDHLAPEDHPQPVATALLAHGSRTGRH